jgi:hypothetical protein
MKSKDLKAKLVPLLRIVDRYHIYVVIVLLFAIFGKVSLELIKVVNPPPNEELYEQKLSELENTRIRLDENVITQIEQRTIRGPNVTPSQIGNPNPFD